MPIKPYLAGAAFAPEAIQTMSVAFEEVCKTLDAPKEAEGYRRMIAGLIMVMARRGEHDPERLRDRVLGVAGMEKRKDSRDAPPDTAQPLRTADSEFSVGCDGEIPADDVYAQWAYSELNSLEQGALYVGVDDLRTKAADNVPFTELSPQERAFLLRQWREVRAFDGSIFAAELANVKTFQLEYWTKAQLGSAYILQHFLQWLAPDHKFLETTLKDWIEAEPSDVLSAHHPLRTPSTGVSFTQEAPVTAARLPQLVDRFLLLDGYHRAAHFWKMAGPASEIAVFVPVQ